MGRRLFDTEDGAGLAAFRVFFGVILAVDAFRYLAAGWVHKYFVAPPVLFKYWGFSWVHPLPEQGLYLLFALLLVGGIAIAVGWQYRAWVVYEAVGHTYIFLLAATKYLNHAYLVCIIAAMMALLPASACLGWDSRKKPRAIHAWPRMLLRAQIVIVYAYGGIAKLNSDWFAGYPVRRWMKRSAEDTSALAGFIESEAFTNVVVYGGVLFDLLIGPALLWRRTRVPAVILAFAFHLTNAHIFSIGIFPWFMMAATTLFLEPEWPRKLPFISRWLAPTGAKADPPSPTTANVVRYGIAGWLAIQLLVPLRHHLYPGPVAWTEEGHYFSWRMKLRSKRGRVLFTVYDQTSEQEWVVDPREYMSKRQARKMVGKPDLVLQYAHHLAARARQDLGHSVEVRAEAWVSLNYRERQQLIDPNVDLARQEHTLGPSAWILSFTETPLPKS